MEVLCQVILEFMSTEALFQGAVKGQGYLARLFGDHYNCRVRFVAQAQSSSMARAQGAGSFVYFCQRKLTASCQNPIAPDDDTHIVERGSGPKNTPQKFRAHPSIESDTGFS